MLQRHSRHWSRAHLCLAIVALALGACGTADAQDRTLTAGQKKESAPAPAEWETFDILVDFQNLPRTYSCDELWYKFRDLLQKLGARADMTITPYDCGYVGGGQALSPHVEVEFQLPRLLQGAATRYAQMSIVQKSVRVTAGSPSSLGAHDCEFARQLIDRFFPALPLQVSTSDFSCSSNPPSYAITINARLVVP